MNISAIWALLKPVIIITLTIVGYFFAPDFFTRNLFLAIAGLSILFRGGAIWAGIKEVFSALK
ncbi:MAG: hypothetical protein ACPGRW_06085 [Flavobacteriaceae bacterium]